jgi:hypothetical protein
LQRDGKVKAKVSLEKITVAEVEYSWQLRHAWRADPDIGMEGISVSVWLRPGFTRELVIDFPFSEFGLDRSPKRANLVAALMPQSGPASPQAGGRSRLVVFSVSKYQTISSVV